MSTELRTHGAFLSEAAAEIRRLGKAVVADLVEIGNLLTECKERLSHGAWLPWLDQEFKWSDQTARNFMHLYAMAAESKTVLESGSAVARSLSLGRSKHAGGCAHRGHRPRSWRRAAQSRRDQVDH